MICNTKLTVQTGGKCQCKEDMKWNEATGECQVMCFILVIIIIYMRYRKLSLDYKHLLLINFWIFMICFLLFDENTQ